MFAIFLVKDGRVRAKSLQEPHLFLCEGREYDPLCRGKIDEYPTGKC